MINLTDILVNMEIIAWKTNMVLIATCLQIRDRKASRKQNTLVLNERLDHIQEGNIHKVIIESNKIQHLIKKKNRGNREKTRKSLIG